MNSNLRLLLPSFTSCTWERTCLRNFVAAFLAVTLLSLTACSKLTEDNLQKIHNGMTTDDVKAILGEPTNTQSGNALSLVHQPTAIGYSTDTQSRRALDISGAASLYHTSTSDVKITFVNDKVVTTEGEFK
jgi:hypothetical protein